MDYFFLIEFNSRKVDAAQLMTNIKNLGCEVHYLSGDIVGNGILGIVNAPSLTMRDTFFKNIAYMVQKINNLPDGPYPSTASGDDRYGDLATWAYTTIGELVQGLKRLPYDGKNPLLPYQIETILHGGVTGVHGGG